MHLNVLFSFICPGRNMGKKMLKTILKKFSWKKKGHIRLIQTVKNQVFFFFLRVTKNQVRVRDIRAYFSQIKFSHLLYLTPTKSCWTQTLSTQPVGYV